MLGPVGKALWFVETHFADDLDLDEIAGVAGVSRFHLSRAFSVATGYSIMGYLRARRLSEAARRLARGAPDILALALESGYGSHEAFTRAFRDHFGVTPEQIRRHGHLQQICLMEALKMDETLLPDLQPQRFETSRPRVVVGLQQRFDGAGSAGIPALWQQLGPHLGHIPGQIGRAAYGVVHNCDDEGAFDYLCGVEVSETATIPPEWTRLTIPQQHYAVFHHGDHVSTIRRTCNTIWSKWLPESDFVGSDAPFFELYGEQFDGRTGLGGLEIWVPVNPRGDKDK